MQDNTKQVTEDICKYLTEKGIDYHIPFEGRIIVSKFKHINIRIWFDFRYDFTNNLIVGRVDTKLDITTNTRTGTTLPDAIELRESLSKAIQLAAELIVEFGNVDIYKYLEDVNQVILELIDHYAYEDTYDGLSNVIAKVSNEAYIPVGQLIINNGCTYKVVSQKGNQIELELDHIDREKHDVAF